MIKAVVYRSDMNVVVEINGAGVAGHVEVVVMGSKKGTYPVGNHADWSRVTQEFCKHIHGAIAGQSSCGVALHLCSLIFPFGSVPGGGGYGTPNYTPLQKHLVDMWSKDKAESPEDAMPLITKMVEQGGWRSLHSQR